MASRRFRLTGPGHLVEIHLVQRELPHQEGVEIRRTVARHLEAHRGAVATMRQFAFERAAQVVDFFVVDEQVAVARHAELVAAEHFHAREQLGHELLHDAGQQHETLAPVFLGQCHHARQRTRCLHDGEAGIAAERILAGEAHDEIQALVLDARKWPRWIEAERRQAPARLRARNIVRATVRCRRPRWCAPAVRCPAGAGPAAARRSDRRTARPRDGACDRGSPAAVR